jgi:hypothetical protein
MKAQYFPPTFNERQFHCPRCGVYASQVWCDLRINEESQWTQTEFMGSECMHCHEWSFWYDGRLIVPSDSNVEPPHKDLPEECRTDYEEARDIIGRSPRGAVALLRLTLQKIMPTLGEAGQNINDDIKSLVSKGLPPVVQQALDVCRVVGNNAVHPGELDLQDTPEIAHQLFRLINFIVEDRISRPKEIEALYTQLPKGALDAIEKRDG